MFNLEWIMTVHNVRRFTQSDKSTELVRDSAFFSTSFGLYLLKSAVIKAVSSSSIHLFPPRNLQ